MRLHEGTFTTKDGLTLFERAWLPDGETRAVVVVVHGYAEHSGRYTHVGEALAKRGYVVESLDLRGHGKSEGDRATVRSFALFLRNLRLFIKRVRARHAGKPLFALGHSMGGAIVTLYAIIDRPDVNGVVLSGPAIASRGGAWRVIAPIFSAVGRLFPNLPLTPLKAETVSNDPAVVAAYDADPLVYRGKMKAGLLRAFIDALRRIQDGMDSISVPLLLMHGTADELADVTGSEELYARAGSTDKTLKLYEGLAHEIFNEPEKERVISDLIAWLDSHAAPATAAIEAESRS